MKNPARLPFEKGVSQKIANRPPTDPGEELTRQLAAMGEDDIANAERFARRCGHKVVFSHSRGFLVFRWKTVPADDRYLCVELAKEVVNNFAEEPPQMATEEARTRRAKLCKN